VCAPLPSGGPNGAPGVQAANAPLSIEQVKVEPVSLEAKLNAGFGLAEVNGKPSALALGTGSAPPNWSAKLRVIQDGSPPGWIGPLSWFVPQTTSVFVGSGLPPA
jgi:hypothetical protein